MTSETESMLLVENFQEALAITEYLKSLDSADIKKFLIFIKGANFAQDFKTITSAI